MGYYADQSKGYAIATKGLVTDLELHETLKKTGTTYNSPVINETVIGGVILSGVYGYIFYKLLSSLNNPNQFKSKQKKASDEPNAKSFSDIGGCQKAKEAISEIIEFIKHPQIF